jgi:hypothetical protein
MIFLQMLVYYSIMYMYDFFSNSQNVYNKWVGVRCFKFWFDFFFKIHQNLHFLLKFENYFVLISITLNVFF